MTNLRSLPLCALASALLSCVAMAQSAAPTVRIISAIDENHLVTLAGNVNPHANAQNDRGAVSGDFALPDLTLVLSRSADQQAAFDAYVAGEYDPGSANFHQWLTPAEIGERFGPAQADIATITGWLASQGFAVSSVAPDRMTIRFSGTAAQVQSAFHTEIHALSVKGLTHYANMSDPQIPAALAPVVMGIKELHNFLPRPMHHVGSVVEFNRQAGQWQRMSAPAGATAPAAMGGGKTPALTTGLHPEFGFSGGSGSSTYLEEDVGPYDFATMYNVLPLWNAATPINGTGQTIAIAGTSEIALSDVTTFRSVFGLPAGLTPKEIDTHTNGTTAGECTSSSGYCTSNDLLENSLDVEWSGAVAPGAQVDLVVTGQPASCQSSNSGCLDTVYDSAQYVVQNVLTLGAHILSLSYGECELGEGTSGNVAYYDLWQSAAAEGIAVFVATGDSGSPSCDQGGSNSVGWPYSAYWGLSVSGLASTPYNTAVGGTDFSWCQPVLNGSGNVTGCASSMSTAGPYWKTSNTTNQASAAGYVPETPWNDTCANPIVAKYLESVATFVGVSKVSNPEAACNFVLNNDSAIYQQYSVMLAPYVDTTGGSGGASNCVTNTTNPNGTAVGTCTSGATSTGSSYGSIALSNDGWVKPSWQTGVSGIPGDGVRDIPDVSFFAGDGSLNSATLVCASPLLGTSCNLSINANTGSPNMIEVGGTSVATPEMAGVMALINQKAGAPQGNPNAQLYVLAGKQNYASCSAESVTAGSSSCYFNDVDQGTIGMPCDYGAAEGGWSYNSQSQSWYQMGSTAGIQSPNCAALNSGDTIGTLVVPGSSNTQAFNAAVGFDEATGLGSMNVANVVNAWTSTIIGTATATVTITPGSGTINSNQTLGVTVKVTGTGVTPTGSATLTASGVTYSATHALDNTGSYAFTVPINTFTATGTVTLTANYSGDTVYAAASNSTTVSVTYIPPPTYGINAITNPTAISSPGGTTTASVTVASTNGYAGTVTLGCSLTTAPQGATDLPTCTGSPQVTLSGTATSGSGQFTINTTAATAAVSYPKVGGGKGWLGAGSGAVLALLVFFGIPARRKSWRAMLGMVVLLAALGSLAACGGGGGGGGGGGNSNPGTTTGQYTFTVTSSSNPTANPSPSSQTFTVTVN